ncbi:hypothetical protein LE181_17940 [Streptomyces sp. SCA3-4]|uniref:hypothetical protein n=1 Tax=Streptomyces sichuanensis TaxID=2871810 RepID=UPI001CE2DDC4|nr:hypothetical protein [Streptomyces sichuanensis]MCA6094034.1 hypothetical protein [Streptomyces sichuanensis]
MSVPWMPFRRLKDAWSEVPALDWGIVLVVSVVHFVISRWLDGSGSIVDGLTADRRKDTYTTVASISALVGGFGTAAIAQYASSHGAAMQGLRRYFGHSLRKNWSGVLTGMLLVSGGCLILLIVDSGESIGLAGWLAEGLFLFGAVRSIRLVWLFNMLIGVSDRDAVEPERSPAVRVSSSSRNRE